MSSLLVQFPIPSPPPPPPAPWWSAIKYSMLIGELGKKRYLSSKAACVEGRPFPPLALTYFKCAHDFLQQPWIRELSHRLSPRTKMVLTVLTRFFLPVIIPDSLVCPLQNKIAYFFSKFNLLMYRSKEDTPLRRTLSMAPSVSVLMAFDCITFRSTGWVVKCLHPEDSIAKITALYYTVM